MPGHVDCVFVVPELLTVALLAYLIVDHFALAAEADVELLFQGFDIVVVELTASDAEGQVVSVAVDAL